jgi:hypothetical protein
MAGLGVTRITLAAGWNGGIMQSLETRNLGRYQGYGYFPDGDQVALGYSPGMIVIPANLRNVVKSRQHPAPIKQLLSTLHRRVGLRLSRWLGPVKPVPRHEPDPETEQQIRLRQREVLDSINRDGGREVYIVGGGPSLKELDLAPLADKTVITVNYSVFTVPNAAFFVTLDPRFFSKIQDRQAEFDRHPAIKVLIHNWPTDRVVVRNEGLTVGPTGADFSAFPMILRSYEAEGFGRSFLDFRNGANSGYCAIQLALLLGYQRIHLLGFDLTDAGGQQHFHDAYQLDPNCLPSYIRYFRAALKSLPEQWPGVELISHSPVSVLNDLIPYEPFEDAVQVPAE